MNITSGGDLTLRGAVVGGNRVSADVVGNLSIESLQDVSVGQSRQSSSGLNVSLCIPPICYGAVATVATPAQKASAQMYLDVVNSSPQVLAFYRENSIEHPTIAQISEAAGKDAQSRNEIATLTIQAAPYPVVLRSRRPSPAASLRLQSWPETRSGIAL